jgi:hypothetical protein
MNTEFTDEYLDSLSGPPESDSESDSDIHQTITKPPDPTHDEPTPADPTPDPTSEPTPADHTPDPTPTDPTSEPTPDPTPAEPTSDEPTPDPTSDDPTSDEPTPDDPTPEPTMEIDESIKISEKDYNIINQISLTYDTTLIEDLEEKTLQESFHSVASKLNVKYNNTVLQKLIQNHGKQDKPIAEYIIGPKNLTVHFSKEYNKLIYIFGEFHLEDPNCNKFNNPPNTQTIEDYLFELYQNTDVFIDFLFEFPSFGRKKKDYAARNLDEQFYSKKISLYKLFEKFKKCIERPTRNDETCKLGRVHFFNVRDEKTSSLANYSLKMGLQDFSTITTFLNIDENFNHFINFVAKRSSESLQDKLESYFNAHILGNMYNVHEMQKVDRKMYNKIIEFIKLEIKNKIIKNLEILSHDIQIINSRDKSQHAVVTNEVVTAFINMSSFFINIVAIMADVYTLARMFKKFNLSKRGFKGAIYGDQPADSHNIIIYGGDKHSQLYRRFFIYLNFDAVNHTGQSDNNYETCIDMEPIHQPFFTKKSREMKQIDERMDVDFTFNFYFNEGVFT